MKKCRICKREFKPRFNTTQIVCGVACAQAWTRKQNDKKEKDKRKEQRQVDKKRLIQLKTRSKWLAETQKVFNEYIRLRDKGKPCISCGTNKTDVQYHAGHFLSVGAHPELRFEETNCHAQCATCNNIKSGNLLEYRKNLIKLIGRKKYDWLEGPHAMPKWTITEIIAIKEKYQMVVKKYKLVNN